MDAAAAQAKEEADKAAAEIAAADAGIKAAEEASSELEKLDLGKFGGSGRFKRQSISISADGVQVDSTSETVTSSSAYPVPTTCADLLKLMDEITNTLSSNPAGVRPLTTALKDIVTPLAEPCSADDISQLETKRDTAKSTATAAVAKQTNLKAALTEKYNAANEKLQSLNQQLAAQGGSTIAAGTAAPTVATMPTVPGTDGGSGATRGKCFKLDEDQYLDYYTKISEKYHLWSLKTNEPGIWRIVFDQNAAISMSIDVRVNAEDPDISFTCASSSSSSSSSSGSSSSSNQVSIVVDGVPIQTDQSSTMVCQSNSPVPAGEYHLTVSNVDASTSGYTPWDTTPLITTFTVGDKDICTGEISKWFA